MAQGAKPGEGGQLPGFKVYPWIAKTRHATPAFTLAGRIPLRAHCAYCSRELTFEWVGCSSTRHYHAPTAGDLRRVRADHLVFFPDREAAEACGFEPAARSRDGVSAGSSPS